MTTITRFLALLIVCAWAGTSQAQTSWVTTKKNVGTNVCYAPIPPNARLTTIWAQGHGAAANLSMWESVEVITVTNALASGQKLIPCNPDLFNFGDAGWTVMLHSPSRNAYQRGIIHSKDAITVTLTNDYNNFTSDFALVAGDKLFVLSNVFEQVIGPTNTLLYSVDGLLSLTNGAAGMVQMKHASGAGTNNFVRASGR